MTGSPPLLYVIEFQELDIPSVELVTTHGICSSGVMALKAAFNSLRLGDQRTALVVASELASRILTASRYQAAGGEDVVDFGSEFLRWMLSDGAGARKSKDYHPESAVGPSWRISALSSAGFVHVG